MKEGSPLGLFYGQKANRYFLKWYGFVLPNNRYDAVAFRYVRDAVRQKLGLKDNVYNGYISIYTNKSVDGLVTREEVGEEFRSKPHTLNMQLLTEIRKRHFEQHLMDQEGHFPCQAISLDVEAAVLATYLHTFEGYLANHLLAREVYEKRLEEFKDDYDRYAVALCELGHLNIACRQIRMAKTCLAIVEACRSSAARRPDFKAIYLRVCSETNRETGRHEYEAVLSVSYYLEQLYFVLPK